MSSRLFYFFFTFFLVLAACAPEPETAVSPTPPPPVTATSLPTATAVPQTATAPSTISPTIAPSPAATPDPLIISPENIDQLTQLAQFGNGRIDSITWSPDGAAFLVGVSTGIHFYEDTTLLETQLMQASPNQTFISHHQFSPQGDYLVNFSCDSNTCNNFLWQIGSGQPLRSFEYSRMQPQFSRDGQMIIFMERSGEGAWQLVWYDILAGNNAKTLQLPFEPLAINLNNNRVVVYDENEGLLYLYDLDSGEKLYTITTVDPNNKNANPPSIDPFTIVFSQDGNLMAADSSSHALLVWDVPTGNLIYTLDGHTNWLSSIVFSENGRFAATGSRDERAVRVWDLETGNLRHTFSNTWLVAFDPAGGEIAVANDSSVTFYNLETGEQSNSLGGYSPAAHSVALSPDGRYLAIAQENFITLWNVQTRQVVHTFNEEALVLTVAFSPDGRTLAWGGNRGVTVWDLENNLLIGNHQENGNQVGEVLFSPDGTLLTARSSDSVLRIWDAATLTLIYSEPDLIVHHLAFHPSEQQLAIDRIQTTVGGMRWLVQILDLTSLEWLPTLANTGPLIGFVGNGRLLAAEGQNNDVGLISEWDITSGQQLSQFNNQIYIAEAQISPNGRLLIGHSATDNRPLLLDLNTGQQLTNLLLSQARLGLVAFSQDGRFLATVTSDDIIRLWSLPDSTP